MWYLALRKLNTCYDTNARSVKSDRDNLQNVQKNKCALAAM